MAIPSRAHLIRSWPFSRPNQTGAGVLSAVLLSQGPIPKEPTWTGLDAIEPVINRTEFRVVFEVDSASAPVAQRIERRASNAKAAGSTPAGSANCAR
jgi:hypothetical protein